MLRFLRVRRWWDAFPRNFMTRRERVNVYVLYPLAWPLLVVVWWLAIGLVGDIMERLPIGIVFWLMLIALDRIIDRDVDMIRGRRWERIQRALDRHDLRKWGGPRA